MFVDSSCYPKTNSNIYMTIFDYMTTIVSPI